MAKLKPVLFALFTLALCAAAGVGAMHLASKVEKAKGTPIVQLLGMAASGIVASVMLRIASGRTRSRAAHVVDRDPADIDEPVSLVPGTYEEWRADLNKADGPDGLEQWLRKWSGRAVLPKKAPPTPEDAVQGFQGQVPLSSEEHHPCLPGVSGARGMQGYQGGRVVNLAPPPSDNVIRYVDGVIKNEKAYDPWPMHRPIRTGLWVRTPDGRLGMAMNAEPGGGWKIKREGEASWFPMSALRPALPKKGECWTTPSGGPRVYESDVALDQDMFAHAVWVGDLYPVNFGRGPA